MLDKTTNLGDDIQSYAIARLMPQVDVYLDREHLDTFCPEDGEPVAVVFASWWFWRKWNWPPSEYIYPLLAGVHINNYGVKERGTPLTTEWLSGIGKEWFDAYGPCGARDEYTLNFLKEAGIDSYLSGCVTLTLPKQKETPEKGTYVVLNDLDSEQEAQARKWLSGSGFEIKTTCHTVKHNKAKQSYDERMKTVEDMLTLYQNAAFVVTTRLHCTLPCLAMEVPVIAVTDMSQYRISSRWSPYAGWVNMISADDMKEGRIPFDPRNIPAADKAYLKMRESFIKNVRGFFEQAAELKGTATEVKKTSYTKEEALEWQLELMRDANEKWFFSSRDLLKENTALKAEIKELSSSKKSIFTRLKKG